MARDDLHLNETVTIDGLDFVVRKYINEQYVNIFMGGKRVFTTQTGADADVLIEDFKRIVKAMVRFDERLSDA